METQLHVMRDMMARFKEGGSVPGEAAKLPANRTSGKASQSLSLSCLCLLYRFHVWRSWSGLGS